ncbi:hypothetical protein [Seonamhaeicola marinus]|uniref:Sigma-70 family RNA polymerase sigma factor n=1 Tax=Seonamhaeicola marinus TaxID=1912246 RepID=A0A5D0I504_9FLAO|nr:hypothetical protein [Seonamhaeicola marinus]TYA78448.1 hypothetical protein FUA24_08810 [Seonamhaeicola marinus]
MCTIDKLNDRKTKIAFEKRVLGATQHLHTFVKHRLYIAESTGIIPKKLYASNGIIDEAIVKYYEEGYNIDSDVKTIKLKLFKNVVSHLNTLFKKEAFHKTTVSTTSILEEELDDLEESFTVDADLDFVMTEDLNDISYKQNNHHKHLFVYDDKNNSVLNAFEIEEQHLNRSKQILGNLYSWIPLNVSNIIDLLVFGKLSFEEIAIVKNIEVKRVEFIFNEVKDKFKEHID